MQGARGQDLYIQLVVYPQLCRDKIDINYAKMCRQACALQNLYLFCHDIAGDIPLNLLGLPFVPSISLFAFHYHFQLLHYDHPM